MTFPFILCHSLSLKAVKVQWWVKDGARTPGFLHRVSTPESLRLYHNTAILLPRWHVCAQKEWVREYCMCACVYSVCARVQVYIRANSKRTARPRCSLSGFFWPRLHVMEVVRSLRCRALSCLTFSTSPWTTTLVMTSFCWQLSVCVCVCVCFIVHVLSNSVCMRVHAP